MTYPIQEHTHTINGVPGRMHTIHEPQNVRGNLVHRNQTWTSEGRPVTGYGIGGVMHVEIRFDDNCQNGHQSFAITADITTAESRRKRDIAAGGCLHDEITAVFPELAPLIKWHLTSTDGPMHYIANTVYHARDRDCNGRQAGEPSAWDTVIYFGSSPVSHKISSSFAKFLEDRRGTGDFNIEEIQHHEASKPGAYKFGPKYTFAGYGEKWHECPFDDHTTAEQWQMACNSGVFTIGRIITAYSEGKKRDLEAARNAAVWPEATDEELSTDPETLKATLAARLPALIADFRADMERIGLLWEPGEAR